MGRPARFKNAIFESATRLFGQRGLAGTGIREIAREAGVSEAALYRHWKGKKQLAEDIFLAGMAELHARLLGEVPKTGPAREAVRATVRIFFEAYDNNSQVVHYLLLNQHDLWRTIDRADPNPVGFWFDLLRSRASQFDLAEHLSGDVAGPITLGMILRPAIAASYGSIELPMTRHTDAVSCAICRVLGLPWIPDQAQPSTPSSST